MTIRGAKQVARSGPPLRSQEFAVALPNVGGARVAAYKREDGAKSLDCTSM